MMNYSERCYDVKKEPMLRFPGFEGEWEQRKLGEVMTERNVQHPQSDKYPLVSFTVENGVTPKTDRYKREQLVKGDKKEKKYKETRLDDIVYNPANLKFGAIARNKYGNAVFSPIYITYEINKNIVIPLYIENYVTRSTFIKKALRFQQGTVYERMSVNPEDFETLSILFPSLQEQQKIASLFTELDNLIQSAEKELEGYRELKQGMLQKMFPKKGEKVPEIRFPEFTGDWEQRKLAEITKTTIGEFVIKTKQSDSYPYPVFNGGVSNTGFYCDFNNEGNKILVSARGANAGYVNIVKTRYWAGNSCYSVDLINKNEFNTDFIYQEMKRNQTRFTQNQQAANIPSVSKADVENFVIDVPSYDEQKRIAGYFENLDNLIVSQQQELDGYKELKKGLLQQMFC